MIDQCDHVRVATPGEAQGLMVRVRARVRANRAVLRAARLKVSGPYP